MSWVDIESADDFIKGRASRRFSEMLRAGGMMAVAWDRDALQEDVDPTWTPRLYEPFRDTTVVFLSSRPLCYYWDSTNERWLRSVDGRFPRPEGEDYAE